GVVPVAAGRMRFLPLHDYRDGAVHSLASGEARPIDVRRKLVDAAYLTNSIPLTHERRFSVADGVDCIPPNDLPRRIGNAEHFVVLGAGKTAIDSCVWLLAAGVPPASLTWVVPRDPWLWNRATTQPGPEFFDQVFAAFAERQEALARAESGADFAARMESAGIWLRVDPDVEPQFFHGATISERELEQLRRIGNVVRLGRVESIDDGGMTLANGRTDCPAGSVYVDCTASAISPRPTKPVFDGERITLQMIRFPQLPFSAALIAFLEATRDDDADKNRFAAALPLPDTIDDYLRAMLPDMMNRYHANRDADVRKWIGESRLEGYAKIARQINPADSAKLAILNRIRESSKAAAANVQRLTG
ncbi:MAG: NAD(P)/FAD-dependent oxidoreductase, partial [Pseudomonadota bacterium]